MRMKKSKINKILFFNLSKIIDEEIINKGIIRSHFYFLIENVLYKLYVFSMFIYIIFLNYIFLKLLEDISVENKVIFLD